MKKILIISISIALMACNKSEDQCKCGEVIEHYRMVFNPNNLGIKGKIKSKPKIKVINNCSGKEKVFTIEFDDSSLVGEQYCSKRLW